MKREPAAYKKYELFADQILLAAIPPENKEVITKKLGLLTCFLDTSDYRQNQTA
jgi:hypothetical protein